MIKGLNFSAPFFLPFFKDDIRVVKWMDLEKLFLIFLFYMGDAEVL